MTKRDLYAEITRKIVDKLEAGVLPWRQPWDDGGLGIQPLRACGARYQGINVLLLWCAAAERGFDSPYWMTYRQAQTMGAQVRKGARSEMIVKVGHFEKENPDDPDNPQRIPFLKKFNVFNVGEIDGLTDSYYPRPAVPNDWERLEGAESFFSAIPATVRHGGNRAFYRPSDDSVNLPPRESFYTADGYYSVRAHELGHWTGAESRLNRQFGRRFGDKAYAFEELIAELSAAFTCAHLGIVNEPRDDTAAYVASWVKVLENDKRAIFTAASAADKATEYLVTAADEERKAAA